MKFNKDIGLLVFFIVLFLFSLISLTSGLFASILALFTCISSFFGIIATIDKILHTKKGP